MVRLNKDDLQFILKQIKISEAHSAGIPLTEIRLGADGFAALPGDPAYNPATLGPLAISDPHVPNGLRTVDGTYNNIVPGRETWGAADQVMPRMLDGNFINEGDDQMAFGPPGAPVVTNNDYGVIGAPSSPLVNGGHTGNVADADPRTISNLVVDMSVNNIAAVVAWLNNEFAQAAWAEQYPGLTPVMPGQLTDPETEREITNEDLAFIPNIAPDEGLSAPFNGWMTFFGQFFDHGLDLISKGGNGTIYVPLQPDDPLITHGPDGIANSGDEVPPELAFMVVTRSTPVDGPGADGVMGTADDTQHESINTTTPFVDQNQTYTSHPSHQVFLREYVLGTDGRPVATGRLLDGANGGLPTWAEIKEQARTVLGIDLADADVLNLPLVLTDAYGEFVRGPNGFAQIVTGIGPDNIPNTADDVTVEGNPAAPIDTVAAAAIRTGHAFLDDIAHAASPLDSQTGLLKAADSDTDINTGPQPAGTYDDELLDRHFITGDGRGNENIGLTAVHHVFHSEHNRLVDANKLEILATGDAAFINQWLTSSNAIGDLGDVPQAADFATHADYMAAVDALGWDGERLFQAARFATEMQYQHLVFEEFARKIQPAIDPFVFNSVTEINPAIFAEFAHVVYRFGHSMLTDDIVRIDTDGTHSDIGLIEAFLNPLAFDNDGALSAEAAAGAVVRGMTTVQGNEIDEFVVGALRNNLLGLPLDLPAINIARGRDTGMPTLNEAREELYSATGNATFLKPYASWVDFAANLKTPMSVVNFIAAYGTHSLITAEDTLEGKRAAALTLVLGAPMTVLGDPNDPADDRTLSVPTDRFDFLNSRGAWNAANNGLNTIDLWIGGLAEKQMPFGGMLGSTFNAIFEAQLEVLQDADRFYYLTRTQGLNFLNELENNAFSKLLMANTDLVEPGLDGIKGTADDVIRQHIGIDSFAKYDHVLELDLSVQAEADPTGNDPILEALGLSKVQRDNPATAVDETLTQTFIRYTGGEHVVFGGTSGDDTIIADFGDDAIWGDAGNDRIEAGAGVDLVIGGFGDDIITDSGDTGDFLKGEEGNDVIANSNGIDILMGGDGKDAFFVGVDDTEVFAGEGDDFILGGDGINLLLGNEGDDWMEGGAGFDTTAGDNSQLFFNSTIIGHDVMFAGGDEHDFDAESGDDIMVQGESVMRNEGMFGFDWAIFKGMALDGYADMRIGIFTTEEQDILRNRFDKTEALSGWDNDDTLIGDHRTAPAVGEVPETPTVGGNENVFFNDGLDQAGIDRIAGLNQIVGLAPGQQFFEAGNILLGGAGSDLMQGNGGDDILDGDRWLNVRISIRDLAGNELDTIDSMSDTLHNVELGWAGRTLQSLMLDGTINPVQLNIVREILTADPGTGVDTAVYGDVMDNYTITGDDATGTLTVAHTGFGTDPLVIVDDAVDTLRNVEQLRFSDGQGGFVTVSTATFFQQPATGQPVVSDATPTEGQALSVDVSAIQDVNGLGAFTYQWQALVGGTWTNIANATTPTFTPQDLALTQFGAQAGLQLRVAVSFVDGSGNLETVVSEPTGPTGVNWDGIPATNNSFVGTTGDDIADGVGPLFIFGGNDTLTGGGGNDALNGNGGTDTAVYAGAAANFNFALAGANLTVTDMTGAEGIDTLASIEQLRFAGQTYTRVNGTAAGQTLNGGTGANANRQDVLLGFGGNDALNGNGGNDILVGGGNNDTVNGGAGNDALLWRVGDGADFMDGGANTDTVHVSGDAGQETFHIWTRAEALAAGINALNALTEIVITRNGTDNASIIAQLDNIEEIVISGRGGGDTFVTHGDFAPTSLLTSTITLEGGEGDDIVDMSGLTSAHRVVFRSNGGNDTVIGTVRPQDVFDMGDAGTPTAPDGQGAFALTARDLEGLKNLVQGRQAFADDDDTEGATGVRDLEGTGNNADHPDYGASTQPFIRITQAHYGAPNAAGNNLEINPIFDGLDPRTISDIIGTQEADLPKAEGDANIFFMAFGQYFDHGLDFVPKNAAYGKIAIGGTDVAGPPNPANPADLTRAEVYGFDDNGIPTHLNKASPYVDQNQAYGSTELVGQLLRESDGNGGFGMRLLAGGADPSNPSFNLLPTLREALFHHWQNGSVFSDAGLGIAGQTLQEAYPSLYDEATGTFNAAALASVVSNFMGSGYPLLLDVNPFISTLDHYVVGDGRGNENFALTSMHTIWARNHNFHVDKLVEAGFQGTVEEVFQAAKMLNEAEYQRVVFTEFADTLIGGIQGDGDHGHDGYNPDADARISHEFAAAVYRVGHSLIGQTMTVIGADGQPKQVALFDAFLNPSNDPSVLPASLPPGYVPQPGYAQLGVSSILAGIANQPAEAVDFNIVDAVRNDLVRINADLFAFNVARGRDVGLGTLNQIRMDLAASTDPYVSDAVGFAGGDLSPYASWEDFQARNGLSNTVIDQFKQAYPDLVLSTPEQIEAFVAANPDIQLLDGTNGSKVVKGIDRVDLWVGGLAEAHINGGMVGETFWVVLHEQFDRLQEADRFYYLDRFDNFDFYENFVDGQEFSDIVARNTGLEGLPENIFAVSDEDTGAGDGQGDDDTADPGDGQGDNDTGDDDDTTDPGDGQGDDDTDDDGLPTTPPGGGIGIAAPLVGTAASDVLTGTQNDDDVIALASDDVVLTGAGADTVSAGEGADFVKTGDGGDMVFAGAGDDQVFGEGGNDMLYGEAGADRLFGGAGDDLLDAGAGDDTVMAGDGDDVIVGAIGDGNDVYFGDAGSDTLDLSAITANLTVDLGGSRGMATSAQSGSDTLAGIENVITGSGNDTITANNAVNVLDGGAGDDTFRFETTATADGDLIVGFQPGDKIDLAAIDADFGTAGDQAFTIGTSLTGPGQLTVTHETTSAGDVTVVQGNVGGDAQPDFEIRIEGNHSLNQANFSL